MCFCTFEIVLFSNFRALCKVNAVIDVSETNEDHLEIHFNVEELPWTYVYGNTETGEDEALLAVKAGIPNISGTL